MALLEGLLASKVTKYWWCDGRMVPDIDTIVAQRRKSGVRKGWVEVGIAAADYGLTHHVVYWENDSLRIGGLEGDMGRGELMKNEPTYAHLPADAAAAFRNADSVLFGAADEVRADLLVTDRKFLLDGHWSAGIPTMPCTLADALVLVSQFLRLRGVYRGWPREKGELNFILTRRQYFWVATRAALPEGWRWFSHCLAAERQGVDDLGHTASAAFHRIGRALRARDALRWHLTLKQTNDIADDTLAEVDHILVDLVGAFDAAARVADCALNFGSDPFRIGWQRTDDWLKRVGKTAPDLAAVLEPGSHAADVFKVIRIMRNTVHGAGLRSVGVGNLQRRREKTVVGLSVADTRKLMAVVERRNWSTEWGLKQFTDDRVYVEPGAFVEHVLRASLPILNNLMRETPVENLGVDPGPRSTPPQSDNWTDPFAVRHQRSILYQLGFDDLAQAHIP